MARDRERRKALRESGTSAPSPPANSGGGKSTTAAHLAIAKEVDTFTSASRIFGLKNKPRVERFLIIPLDAFGVEMISIGLLLEKKASAVDRRNVRITQLLREDA